MLTVGAATGRWTEPADGLLVGVASGAGFAALETMGYACVTFVNGRGDLAAVDDVLRRRGPLSPAAHLAGTGLTATALWPVSRRRRHSTVLRQFVTVLSSVMVLHPFWEGGGTHRISHHAESPHAHDRLNRRGAEE